MNIKRIALFAATVAAVAIFSSFVEAPKTNVNPYTFEESTFADLKAIYGDNIVDQNGNTIVLEDDDAIEFATPNVEMAAAMPCAERPCGSFQGYINHVLVKQANDCCCTFRYGIECCSGGSLIAILYLIQPNDPDCGL